MWHIDKLTSTLSYENQVVGKLSDSEINILELMISNPGKFYSKSDLLEIGWPGKRVTLSSLVVSVKKIRALFDAKKSDSSFNIITKHGLGYAFHGDASAIYISNENINKEINNEIIECDDVYVNKVNRLHIHSIYLWPLRHLLLLLKIFFVFFVFNFTIQLYIANSSTENCVFVKSNISICSIETVTSALLNEQKKVLTNNNRRYVYGYDYSSKSNLEIPMLLPID